MTLEKLKSLVFRRPFQPLRLVLDSGESYEVRHPESVIVAKAGCVVVDDAKDLIAVFEVDQVSAVEYRKASRARR